MEIPPVQVYDHQTALQARGKPSQPAYPAAPQMQSLVKDLKNNKAWSRIIYSVLSWHLQHLISYLPLFFFLWEYYLLSLFQRIIIYHSYIVSRPRRSLFSPGHHYLSPAIPPSPLPSACSWYHVCLTITKNGLACRAGYTRSSPAIHNKSQNVTSAND